MAEDRKNRERPDEKRKKTSRGEKPAGDSGRDREREKARRGRAAGGSRLRRLGALVGVLILLVVGWLGYRIVSSGGDALDPESWKGEVGKATEETKSNWQKLKPEEFLARAKAGLSDLDKYFEKNPDAKPIESQEELEATLAEADPVVEEPPAAAEPSPREKARTEAMKEYNAARSVLRGWSPGQDAKLRQALEHLDRAAARAEEAGDEALVTKVQEMRYFCLKSHSTH